MAVKTYSCEQDTIDQLAELVYILRMKESAIIRTAIHDYYQKVTEEKMAEKEATK